MFDRHRYLNIHTVIDFSPKNRLTSEPGCFVAVTVPVGIPVCNIAEIELYGTLNVAATQTKITPAEISGSNAWNNSSNDCYKVFDGSTSTYFDGVGNGWVQVNLGQLYDISAIGYAPRGGYEYRCPDGMFMVSKDGVNWETIHTIKAQPSGGMNYVTSFTGGTAAQ